MLSEFGALITSLAYKHGLNANKKTRKSDMIFFFKIILLLVLIKNLRRKIFIIQKGILRE
jgi:hypothetical protein